MNKSSATSRSVQAEKMKAAIIEAAIPLFARGFESVSIQQIAAAAGAKHSLVMYHFGSKEQLWQASALQLMQCFDERMSHHAAKQPSANGEEELAYGQMLSFILALRDIPEYGQMLFSEGSQQTERLSWLHENFFPAIVSHSPHTPHPIMQTTLLRSAIAGALLFTVVAGPQLARSAELEGGKGASELYPMSQAAAEQLARMMSGFLLSQLAQP